MLLVRNVLPSSANPLTIHLTKCTGAATPDRGSPGKVKTDTDILKVDMGYDISDYEKVYPPYGTIKDMEELIKACHDRYHTPSAALGCSAIFANSLKGA
jgi:hypothetical protein